MNNLTKCDILYIITNILVDKLNINTNYVIEDNYDKLLTGSLFCLHEIQMTYLFFEIEKKFNIKIMPQDILDENFNTINKIAEVVIKYTQKEVIK